MPKVIVLVALAMLIACCHAARVKRNVKDFGHGKLDRSGEESVVEHSNEDSAENYSNKRPWCRHIAKSFTATKVKTYFFYAHTVRENQPDLDVAIRFVRDNKVGPKMTVGLGYSWGYDANQTLWEQRFSFIPRGEVQSKFEIDFVKDVKAVDLTEVDEGNVYMLSVVFSDETDSGKALIKLLGLSWELGGGVYFADGSFNPDTYKSPPPGIAFTHSNLETSGSAGLIGVAAGVAAMVPLTVPMVISGLNGALGITSASAAGFVNSLLVPAAGVAAGVGIATGTGLVLGGLVASQFAVRIAVRNLVRRRKFKKNQKYSASVKIFDKLWCQKEFFNQCGQNKLMVCEYKYTASGQVNPACACNMLLNISVGHPAAERYEPLSSRSSAHTEVIGTREKLAQYPAAAGRSVTPVVAEAWVS